MIDLSARAVALAFCLVAFVFRAIPPGLAYPVCDLIGDLASVVARGARRAVEANLRHVLGARQPPDRRLVRQVFRNGARNYYDTFRIPALSGPALERLVQAEGWEHLEAARAGGRGAILVGAHLSSVSLAGQIVARRGYPLVAVVEPIQPRWLFELLARLRAGHGARLLPLGLKAMAELVAALRRNEVVGLIADRDIGRTGLLVPFFDAPASMPSGPAALALRTGAPILVAVALRKPDGTFWGVIEPPLALARTGDLRRDIERATCQIARRFEYYIRHDPAQWTVFQPVWPEER
ncbi:MAG: hypothetical protein HY690_18650 [Chloroflexi bacterium]|nr:hypothetical protein [Chloroflexota bacterium]